MSEHVLLVGGGGREHAIARAIDRSDHDVTMSACAGNKNPGIRDLVETFETVDTTDPAAVTGVAESVDATMAVIGPEAPLEAGVADALDEIGVYAFGPKANEARIETDKAYQREFMEEADIPGCPDYAVFTDPDAACNYIDSYDGDLAIKPTGLTGGKGVRVIGDQVTPEEGKEFIQESGYEEFVLEERLVGEEFTVQAFVANSDVEVTPAIQDHKRAYEGDEGPNTGGMGSYSDSTPMLPFMTEDDYAAATTIIEEVIDALPIYKGILYGQFMLTAEGPKVVEFNARFGDPEAMNTLPVLETDLMNILIAARDGESLPEVTVANKATVCKYAVPAGYPSDPEAGAPVTIDEQAARDAQLFYASVDEQEDGIYTTTSRSFAVVGIEETIAGAEAIAREALETAGTEGLRVRQDIGTAALVDQRIEHMETIRGE